MSRRQAVVIDAGVGNLGNLRRALEALDADAQITSDPEVVRRASCLLLPGVGAFKPPRETLREALEPALAEALDGGAWLLGICVGYQLLFESGEEFGTTDGLGLLPGSVTELPSSVELPHIGWNRLRNVASHPLLEGIDEGSFAYFVHSFAPDGVPDENVLARCMHGRAFAAISGRGRVLGTQFHPEKSGPRVGLKILDNYLEVAHGAAAGA